MFSYSLKQPCCQRQPHKPYLTLKRFTQLFSFFSLSFYTMLNSMHPCPIILVFSIQEGGTKRNTFFFCLIEQTPTITKVQFLFILFSSLFFILSITLGSSISSICYKREGAYPPAIPTWVLLMPKVPRCMMISNPI